MNTNSFKIKLDPKTLGDYKDYIGFLFENQTGKYNLPKTEEDIMKSNQWFNNLPIMVAILSSNPHHAVVGERYMFVGLTNESLNGFVFEVKGINVEFQTIEILDIEKNKKITTTMNAFPARTFVRWANDEDKAKIVNDQEIDYNYIN